MNRSRALMPFLIAALVLASLGNAAALLYPSTLLTRTLTLIGLGVGILLLLVLATFAFVRTAAPPATYRPLVHPLRQTPRPRRGLIFLFSNKDVCNKAVRHHHPTLQQVWLICSPQNNDEANAVAGELRGEFKLPVDVQVINDVNDPLACYEKIDQIYKVLPANLTIDEVIADYTGLPSNASIGMALVCLHRGAALQYVPAKYVNGKPIRPLPPVEMVLQGRPLPCWPA